MGLRSNKKRRERKWEHDLSIKVAVIVDLSTSSIPTVHVAENWFLTLLAALILQTPPPESSMLRPLSVTSVTLPTSTSFHLLQRNPRMANNSEGSSSESSRTTIELESEVDQEFRETRQDCAE